MGKALIIKGADFSQNAIEISTTWYVDRYTDYTLSRTANINNGGWALSDDDNATLQGKTVNTLKFKPVSSGTFKLFVASTKNATSVTEKATITINSSEAGTEVIKEFTPFQIGAGEYLVFGEANDAVGFYFGDSTGLSFYSRIPGNVTRWVKSDNLVLGIAVGYKG